MRYVHDNRQRIIVYRAKKLMDKDICSCNGDKYCSFVAIPIMFLCFDINVYLVLTYKTTTTTMTFMLKTDQAMTTYLGQFNF